ncbi:hypothetical protein EVG20_g5357 [Dentipellis fragilis]|uniref:Uncharacterized protein n=1 Tax=Dentipellis fragilis TaxID=205917 RepID=A0A4Y9YVJ0_9AGAM|nr:hypothetical protein EVG20_g5357 [Dentipellis fragilis]
MARVAFFALLCAQTAFGLTCSKRATDFFNPTTNGGSLLDDAGNGLGEPLNVIVSGLSSPDVLTDDGIVNFARAIGFSEECFGIHLGAPQSANLGDGNGPVNQTIELRQDFGDPGLGTCLESLIGGDHFRHAVPWLGRCVHTDWSSGFQSLPPEWLLGRQWCFIPRDVTTGHTISPDGYDVGRNALVSAAIGSTNFGGVSYSTTAQNITGLITAGSTGVNHGIAQDGIVTLLTVTIV